jgi:hypothetical protein
MECEHMDYHTLEYGVVCDECGELLEPSPDVMRVDKINDYMYGMVIYMRDGTQHHVKIKR